MNAPQEKIVYYMEDEVTALLKDNPVRSEISEGIVNFLKDIREMNARIGSALIKF